MYDYRELQARADAKQKEIEQITARGDLSDTDRDKVHQLMGEINALEQTAGELRDAEVKELREIVARSQAGAVLNPADEAWNGFKDYLRTGDVSGVRPGEIQNASMSTTDANGGYVVPEPKHAELIELYRKTNPVFGNATVFNMVGGDTALKLPFKASHGVVTNATETGARAEQNAPTFTSPTLTCYDYFSDQRATQTYLDSVDGSEEQLIGWMFEDMLEQAEYDAVIGNGTTKIKGLFACTTEYTADLSGVADSLVNTAFLATYFNLPIKYRAKAKWIMKSATLATVAGYAWPNIADTPLARQNENTGEWTIMGKKVLEADSAPSVGNGAYPVAFGDIAAAYAVGIHRSTTILRDPFTAAPYVRFYSLARMGGCAWDYNALRLMKSDDA